MPTTQVETAIHRLHAAGHRQIGIAQEMSCSQSTVSRVIGQDIVSKNVKSKGDRPRTTSAADDRCLQRLVAQKLVLIGQVSDQEMAGQYGNLDFWGYHLSSIEVFGFPKSHTINKTSC